MAVKLRLTRLGRKKRPFYRIVAVDSRKCRDGEYIEKVGHYDPVARPAALVIDHDIAIKWLKDGAQISDTVRSLFRRDGVMLRFDLVKRGAEQAQVEEAVQKHREARDAKIEGKEKAAIAELVKKTTPKKKEEAPKAEEAKAPAAEAAEDTKTDEA